MKKRCNMIKMSMDVIVIFLFAVVSTSVVKATCPSTCNCNYRSFGVGINCYSHYLGRIPALPNDTYYLDLGYNKITDIDIQLCKEMPQLQTIYIDDNVLTEIPVNTFVDCEQIYRIYLHNNKIQSLESNIFINLTQLYELYLQFNEISTIEPFTFMNLPNLRNLYLQFNEISAIEPFTFMNLPNLRNLYLHNNKIQSLESNIFINLTQLYELLLHNNEISVIDSFTFIDLPKLSNLLLHNNEISVIDSFTFIDLPKLSNLSLYGNNISHMKENAFGNLTSLSTLDLTGNQLNCDCSIFPFWLWLMERSSIGTSSKCSNGTLVTSLQSTVLETCHPDNCPQCLNGGKCVAMGYERMCDCLGQWTGKFCQDSQCTSYDCGFGDCYIEPVNGTVLFFYVEIDM